MSGGHFIYNQNELRYLADDIQEIINTNDSEETDEYGDKIGRGYNDDIIDKYTEAVSLLRVVFEMVNRIDYLESGDDSEETFVQHWGESVPSYGQLSNPNAIDTNPNNVNLDPNNLKYYVVSVLTRKVGNNLVPSVNCFTAVDIADLYIKIENHYDCGWAVTSINEITAEEYDKMKNYYITLDKSLKK
jgi:hypothetical protein